MGWVAGKMPSMADQKPALEYEPQVTKGRYFRWFLVFGIAGAILILLLVLFVWGSLIVAGLGKQ